MAIINGTVFPDILTGTVGDDQLFGLAGNDMLIGDRGHDRLDGGTGADTMRGGLGNDTYVVDQVGDVVIDSDQFLVSGGIDTVESRITYTLDETIEHLQLTGTAGINGTGNALNNRITGNDAINILTGLAGNDTLNGLGGTDTLNGGDGNDRLNGGPGGDTMRGGFGNDIYVVDEVGDVVIDPDLFVQNLGVLSGGSDTVESSITYDLGITSIFNNLEHLTLTGTAAINGSGNGNQNSIIGNSANNILSGRAGDDTLIGDAGHDILTGGNGNDTLIGGSDNDILNGGLDNDTASYSTVEAGVWVYLGLAGAQNTGGG